MNVQPCSPDPHLPRSAAQPAEPDPEHTTEPVPTPEPTPASNTKPVKQPPVIDGRSFGKTVLGSAIGRFLAERAEDLWDTFGP